MARRKAISGRPVRSAAQECMAALDAMEETLRAAQSRAAVLREEPTIFGSVTRVSLARAATGAEAEVRYTVRHIHTTGAEMAETPGMAARLPVAPLQVPIPSRCMAIYS